MQQKPFKLLIALLTVSVILNFAFAGFFATRFVQDRALHQFFHLTEYEPPAALRDAFQGALREERSSFVQALRELRVARDRLHDVLTAESLDTASLEANQQEVRTATMILIEVLQRALRQAVSDLPDTERRAIPKLRMKSLIKGGAD